MGAAAVSAVGEAAGALHEGRSEGVTDAGADGAEIVDAAVACVVGEARAVGREGVITAAIVQNAILYICFYNDNDAGALAELDVRAKYTANG